MHHELDTWHKSVYQDVPTDRENVSTRHPISVTFQNLCSVKIYHKHSVTFYQKRIELHYNLWFHVDTRFLQ